jgi:hypothetical protein
MKLNFILSTASAIPMWTGGDVITPTYGSEGATGANSVGCAPCIRSGLHYISKRWSHEYDIAANMATAENTNKDSVCCKTNGSDCTIGYSVAGTTLNTGF